MQTMPHLRKIIFSSIVSLMALSAGAAWWAYREVGKTPGELMDYAQVRLMGHDKLEGIALPVLAQLRIWLDQPSHQELLRLPFVVPAPPPLQRTPAGDSPASGAPATDPSQRILRVGPFEEIRTIAQAARLAKDGDVVEIQAGEYHGDVTLWMQKKLTIRTSGGSARLYADGKSAESKAIWVIRNGDFRIENIDFIGTHVYDHNGAGIRFEGGKLQVINCLFYGNDNGLLTTDHAGSLSIENSEFAYNGFGDGLSHNLYVGKIHTLKITGSYFHHANVGHLIKSRAQYNTIYYNRMTDESGGRASYELDLPNGGVAFVVGNIVQQDVIPQNSTLITYGEEGLVWPENNLYLASNTIVNDQPYGGIFLRTAPGIQKLVSVNNLMVGKGKLHSGTTDMETANDHRVDWSIFVRPSRYDYRLKEEGQSWTFTQPALPELVPGREYVYPHATRPLPVQPAYPGALQAH